MKRTLLAVVLAVMMAASCVCGAMAEAIYYPSPEIQSNLPEERPELSEDYYVHVNYDLLKNTVIPEGKAGYSAFNQLVDDNTKAILEILNNETGEGQQKLVFDYYHRFMDMDARNAAGWKSVMPYGDAILGAETMDQLLATVCAMPELASELLPFRISIEPDSNDSLWEIASLYVPLLDLDDSAEYSEMTSYGERYKKADDVYYAKLLRKYGFDEATAAQMIEDQFALESKFAQKIYSTETSYRADWLQMIYNPYTEEELLALAGAFPVGQILDVYGVNHNEKYIVDQPAFFEALQSILTDDNLEEVKAWMLLRVLDYAATCTDEEAMTARAEWENQKNGSTGMKPLGEMAYTALTGFYQEPLGQLYAERFFSPEEKAEITQIVYDLIAVYRARMEQLDWLGEETKATAIEKLDTMGVYIGYPEAMRYDYSAVEVPADADLFAYEMAYQAAKTVQDGAYAGTLTNRAAWGQMMPAYEVNACYNSVTNSIYFPAAILKKPFYSKDASLAANMGGIGIVIGHEITHAFDTRGSQYDKDGNMANWWTEEDRKAFDERTAAVGERYGSYVLVDDMAVNGDLTIGETVADLGGTSAALQVLADKKAAGEDIDYREFFEQNAYVWFRVLTRERAIYFLKIDPHAPCCLRTNVNLTQFDEFYEAYDVKEGDKMYTAPENRLKVW